MAHHNLLKALAEVLRERRINGKGERPVICDSDLKALAEAVRRDDAAEPPIRWTGQPNAFGETEVPPERRGVLHPRYGEA